MGSALSNKVYGYCRVSAVDQNEDRQLIAMRNMGVPEENIFVEKQSGKDFNRPVYMKMVALLKPDDLLYIKSIDRLGRNYTEILEQWKYITKVKMSDIYVIDMPVLDTRFGKDLLGTFITDLILSILSYVSENERTNIRIRQAEGIAAAKEKGVHFGNTKIELPENFPIIANKWSRKELTLSEAARACGMARSTFYDRAKEWLSKT